METIILIVVTSFATAFFGSFLAPRINAFFEQRTRDRNILMRTLRMLLEIERNLQRQLKHPSLSALADVLPVKAVEMGVVSNEQATETKEATSVLFDQLQIVAPKILPLQSANLDTDFAEVLKDLAVVDPVLAYEISERNDIQSLVAYMNLIPQLSSIGGSESDQHQNRIAAQIGKAISDEIVETSLTNVREDILEVSSKLGRRTLKRMKKYYAEIDSDRNDQIENFANKYLSLIPKSSSSDSSIS